MTVAFPEPEPSADETHAISRCGPDWVLDSQELARWLKAAASHQDGGILHLVSHGSADDYCDHVLAGHDGGDEARVLAGDDRVLAIRSPQPFKRSWRKWDHTKAFRLLPTSKATLLAREAGTQEEMGEALRLLREEAQLTIGQLANMVASLNIAGLRRSTIGRLCTGGSLCATREALVALVGACGVVGVDVEVWVAAWERARAGQRPRGRRPADANSQPSEVLANSAVTADPPVPAEDNLAVGALEEDLGVAGDDDEVLGTWTVTFTRGHVRAAIVLSALFGLASTTSSVPGMRNAGAVVLGVAASIAMFEMIRANTPSPAEVLAAA